MTNAKTYRFKLVIGAETHSNDLFGRIEWVGKNEDDDVIVGSAESVEFELVQFAKDYRAQRTPAVSSYFMRDQVDGERKPMWKAFNSGNLRDEHVKMRPVEIFNANILGKSWISGAQLYESMKRFSRLLSEKTREDLNVENLLSEFPQTIQARQQFLSLDCEFEVSSGFFVRQFCYDFSTRRFNIPAFAMEITRTRIFAPKDIPIIHIDSIPFSSAHTRSSITLR
jgi:tRNA U55 pseudouridine synthase TruB